KNFFGIEAKCASKTPCVSLSTSADRDEPRENAHLGSYRRFRDAEFIASKRPCARSPYLTISSPNASIVVAQWNFSVPELPKWCKPELNQFTISILWHVRSAGVPIASKSL